MSETGWVRRALLPEVVESDAQREKRARADRAETEAGRARGELVSREVVRDLLAPVSALPGLFCSEALARARRLPAVEGGTEPTAMRAEFLAMVETMLRSLDADGRRAVEVVREAAGLSGGDA